MTNVASFPKQINWEKINDPKKFRQALGQFATGVTIVTTKSNQPEDSETHQLEGVTINSFNSLSLDPPLILWSLGKNTRSLSTFSNAEYYLINVLSASQQKLCEHFAYTPPPRFVGIDYELSPAGMPVLPDALLWLECRHHQHIDLGDHRLFVGEVTAFSNGNKNLPLIFYAGQFCQLP